MDIVTPLLAAGGLAIGLPVIAILLVIGTWTLYLAFTGSFAGIFAVLCALIVFPVFFVPYLAICLPFAILARIFCPPDSATE